MRGPRTLRPRTRSALRSATLAVALTALVACGAGPQVESGGAAPAGGRADPSTAPSSGGNGNGPDVSTGAPAVPALTDTYPGMPPVPDPTNLYSETGPDNRNPATDGALFRVYVPNEASGTVMVIDPTTFKVIDTFQTGVIPQHVVPSYDMTVLYALNNTSDSITPIDPKTGKAGKNIKVEDPYNLYFTPDGKEAIVIEEEHQTITWTDPKTFEVHNKVTTQCDGLNHIDYAISGKYALMTCEFEGAIIKVDMVEKKVVGKMKIDISTSNKANPIKPISQPQDVRVAPDGKVFYIADLITDGVYVIDGDSFQQIDFIPTGVGTHGLYPSRDGKKLYVINRGTNTIPPVGSFKGKGKGSVTVLDFATRKVEANWPVPGAGSPDMGNLTADGKQLWLGGRYDAEVYVFDTQTGSLLARVPAGQNPHGLTVWPQPGRYSLGHTGNMR